MHNDPVSVLTALYTAWKVQDVAGVMELCTPDICYVVHEPPDITGTGGCMVGTDEVRRFLTAMARDWDFLEVVPGEFHIDGNDIRDQAHLPKDFDDQRLRKVLDELKTKLRSAGTQAAVLISLLPVKGRFSLDLSPSAIVLRN